MQVTFLLRLSLFSAAIFAATAMVRLEAQEKGSLFVRNQPAQKVAPHPAVVRIVAFESKSQSCGSGTYIGESGEYGLILTNWHVVSDSKGLLQVRFPDGFTSYAVTLLYDKTWDLAALAVTKPPTGLKTVPIATKAPAYHDPLWLAGYGSGNYRLIGGHCVKYVAPKIGLPNEWLEVSVPSRMGDSGGPILNAQGELAGVLFGSDRYGTLGSYCGRVKLFADQAMERFKLIPQEPNSLYAMVDEKGMRMSLNPSENNLVPIMKNNAKNGVKDEEDIHLTVLREREKAAMEEYDYLDPCSDLAPELLGPGRVTEVPSEKFAGQFPDDGAEATGISGDSNVKSSEMKLPGALVESTIGDRYSAQTIDPEEPPQAAEANGVAVQQHSQQSGTGKERTVYIIIGVLVTFFVLFNVVKMLSIIEESDPILAQGEKS